jgi:hypothetical protein
LYRRAIGLDASSIAVDPDWPTAHGVGLPSRLTRYPAFAILPSWPFIHLTSASGCSLDLGITAATI